MPRGGDLKKNKEVRAVKRTLMKKSSRGVNNRNPAKGEGKKNRGQGKKGKCAANLPAKSDSASPLTRAATGSSTSRGGNRANQRQLIPVCGFKRGLPAEAILKLVSVMGRLMYVIKWRGADGTDLVPAGVAKARCPELVIEFYETLAMNLFAI